MKALRTKFEIWAAILCFTGLAEPVLGQVNLVSIGHTNNGGTASGVAIAQGISVPGTYALLANGIDGLRVYDVSNPANPLNIGHIDNGGTAFGVAVSGHYAYLANGNDGMRVYEILSPSNPVNVVQTNFDTFVRSVAVSGSHAYLGGHSRFGIMKISNPGTPLLVSSNNTSGDVYSVAVSGNFAALAQGNLAMDAFSITNSTNASGLGRTTNGLTAMGVAIFSGHYACLANGHDGFRIYDLAQPGIPTVSHITYNPANDFAQAIAVSGNFAYVAADGLNAYDIIDPTNPKLVGRSTNSVLGPPGSMTVSGPNIYLAAATDGLRIYAIQPQLGVTPTNSTQLLFSWPAVASFVLQQNADLRTTNWVTLTNLPSAVGSQSQIFLTAPGIDMFYRLKSQ